MSELIIATNDRMMMPLTLFHPLSEAQQSLITQEISDFFAGMHGHGIGFYESADGLHSGIGIGGHASIFNLEDIHALASLLKKASGHDSGEDFPVLGNLLLMADYIEGNPHPSKYPNVDEQFTVMACTFIDLAIGAQYDRSTTPWEKGALKVFSALAGKEPASKQRADIRAHIVQRKMES